MGQFEQHKNAEAAAVNVPLLHIEGFHVEFAQELDDRLEGKIGEMLVVDRVKLHLIDEISKIRRFEDKNPARVKQPIDALDKVAQIMNVGKNVGGGDQGGLAMRLRDLDRPGTLEEFI